jgi:DNA-binding NtrC family response regulator
MILVPIEYPFLVASVRRNSTMRTKNEKHSQDSSSISKSVLIIEDDQDSADTIAEMLMILGHKPVIENSRDDALERLKGSFFDFILMDFRMPGMSAEVFANKVQEHFPTIHTVLISANANSKEIARTLRLDSSLQKPFTLEQLLHILNRQIRVLDSRSGPRRHESFRG